MVLAYKAALGTQCGYYPFARNFQPACQHAVIREFGPFLAFHCPSIDISTELGMIAGLCCVFVNLACSSM